MPIARAKTAHLSGLSAEIVTVEVDISNGLNAVSIVGMGDRAVEEAKDRISAAIKNSGYVSPKQKNQKVVISLAPADMRKEGTAFDLPMAVAYLAAAEHVELGDDTALFAGELSLDGSVSRIAGALPIACAAAARGFSRIFVPAENAQEAAAAESIAVYGVDSLTETVDILSGKKRPRPAVSMAFGSDDGSGAEAGSDRDISDIRGNEAAKRALEIAAAGAHNLLLFGPPGTGKTMLAESLVSLLPPLTRAESIEVSSIHSASEILNGKLVRRPPFRSPHHTASYPAIIGGGAFPRPGELTLAHRGVLFLDELPEFDRSVLEALREPLEDRIITISRARGSCSFPARTILVAAMNPCPCGKPQNGGCACSAAVLRAYARRISGPILDRIDMWVGVEKVDYEKMGRAGTAEAGGAGSSAQVRARVLAARQIQEKRFRIHGIAKQWNSEMDARDIERTIIMEDSARALLIRAGERLALSGRGFHRIMKVARTIADLASRETVGEEHVLEAIRYRQNMRQAESRLA